MAGWGNGLNSKFRSQIVESSNLDVVCICETHLVGEEIISLDSYTWLGLNRKHILQSARRGSGGVGVLVKDRLFKYYSISILQSDFEGILWVQFIGLEDRESFCLCVCYLPPANSSRGNSATEFFDQLKCNICSLQNIETYFVCGDFNARCNNLVDTPSNDTNIPKRTIVDIGPANSHGRELIDFVRISSLCMLNGRTADSNRFTSISTKGAAVVDYCLVPTYCDTKFLEFNINDVVTMADNFNINTPTKMPDHSLLTWQLEVHNAPPGVSSTVQKVYRRTPEDYMQSDTSLAKIDSLIQQLEDASFKSAVNDVYEQFCQVIDSELITKKHSNRHKRHKPWWPPNLSLLRRQTKQTRTTWLSQKLNPNLKQAYLAAQKMFDQEVSRAKPKHYRDQQQCIVDSICSNPRKFWSKINELGIQRHKNKVLPDSMLNEEKSLVNDSKLVLDVWKNYFDTLLNNGTSIHPPHLDPSQAFLGNTEILNEPFTFEKIEFALNKVNSKSAPGPDQIQVGFIKNQPCANFLCRWMEPRARIGLNLDT